MQSMLLLKKMRLNKTAFLISKAFEVTCLKWNRIRISFVYYFNLSLNSIKLNWVFQLKVLK